MMTTKIAQPGGSVAGSGAYRGRRMTPFIPVASVEHLTKLFGDVTAVRDVSFALEAGTNTGLLGPNGAGKTTTLRVLLGLAKPTSGIALINGCRYADLADPARTVGALLESGDFHPGRSGRDHLRVLALAAGVSPSRVGELLELVGLAAASRRAVKTYSLGMRQRLGLATAMLGDPKLLVLDEPANGLDPVGVRWLRELLRSFAKRGGTVVVSSHALAEIAQTVDRVVIIDRGTLVADAPLKKIAAEGQSLEDAYVALTSGGGA